MRFSAGWRCTTFILLILFVSVTFAEPAYSKSKQHESTDKDKSKEEPTVIDNASSQAQPEAKSSSFSIKSDNPKLNINTEIKSDAAKTKELKSPESVDSSSFSASSPTSQTAYSSKESPGKIDAKPDDSDKKELPTDAKEVETLNFSDDSVEFIKVIFQLGDNNDEKDEGTDDSKVETKNDEVADSSKENKRSEEGMKLNKDLENHVKYMTNSILRSLSKNAQEADTEDQEPNEFEHLEPKPANSDLEAEEGLNEEQLAMHNEFRKSVENSDFDTLFRLADGGHSKSQDQILNGYLFAKIPFNLDALVQRVIRYAAQGNAMANMFKGFLYASGLGVETNQAKSFIYMSGAAMSGNTFARMALGYRYLSGVLVEADCDTALEYYQRVAEDVVRSVGLSGGQFIQRIRFQDEAENPSKTSTFSTDILQYYQYMAEKGDPAAQVVLGQLYLQGGRGVQQDSDKAMKYFQPAAEEGNSNAMAYLGKIYFEVHHDYAKAFDYFTKAADNDNAIGQSGLGLMYLYGKGVKRDFAKAFKFLNLSASQGWIESQFYIGLMYLKGYGVSKDYKNAIRYFMLASQAGNVLAIYNLGQMHVTGRGTLKMCKNAAELFKNVAERGKWATLIMDAYTDYREGRVLESYFKYSFLAELGYEVAQSNAATILDRNELKHIYDQKETFARAFKYWHRSAAQGYSIARVKLGDYYYYGQGTKVDLEQAAEEYRTAADEKHCAQALFNLGYMYEQGLGLPRDLHLAKRYYDLAEKSSTDAQVPVALARFKLFWVHLLENSNLKFSLDELTEHIWDENWLIDVWDIVSITLLSIFVAIIFMYRRVAAV